MVKSAVFDSSPWVFLTKIGVTDLGLGLFDQVYVPSSVSEEILAKEDESAALLREAQTEKRVVVLGAENRRLVAALGNRLGRGEAEAIAIAIEKKADIICLDDHAARSEATRLGLEVKGTLGIIRRLMELDRFQCNLEDLLESLKRVDFRVKDYIYWEIFRDIKQRRSYRTAACCGSWQTARWTQEPLVWREMLLRN